MHQALGFSGIRKSIAMMPRFSSSSQNDNEAGMQKCTSASRLIAMSFRRLFLHGLLPSRARLRFTGGANNTTSPKIEQSVRGLTCRQSVSHVSEQVSTMSPGRTLVPAISRQFRHAGDAGRASFFRPLDISYNPNVCLITLAHSIGDAPLATTLRTRPRLQRAEPKNLYRVGESRPRLM